MALTPSSPVIAEVDMGADSSPATVRATVVQASTIFYDTPATLDKAERLLAEAAGYGSQLVVFPEAFVGGYPRGSNFGVTIGSRAAKGKEEFRKYHASAIDVPGPEVDQLAAMAGKYKVYLVMGVIERDGYTLYCTVLFFDSQGCYLGKHRKLMPTALERIIWGFGDGSTIPVFETPIGKIGAVICWENRMPLLRTAMYAKGIEIYCAPTADDREIWQASMTHIALEGGCFVLSASQFCRRKDYPPPPEYVFSGTEEDLTPDSVVCAGGSVIISPSGTVLAGPNYDGEALISADLVPMIQNLETTLRVGAVPQVPQFRPPVAQPPQLVTTTNVKKSDNKVKSEEPKMMGNAVPPTVELAEQQKYSFSMLSCTLLHIQLLN